MSILAALFPWLFVIKILDEKYDDSRLAKALTPPVFVEPTQAQKDAGVHWQDLNKPKGDR
jgi:hypothetical protein